MEVNTVVILIDALGFELAARHRFHPGGLTNRVRLGTVLGFSQAALTSIFTGLTPDRHGLWMMYSFAHGSSAFGWLRLIPKSVSSEKLWLRRLIRWKLENLDGVRSYYSLYSVPRGILRHLDLPARRDLFAVGGAQGAWSIFDELDRRGRSWLVWDYRIPEGKAFDELEKALREKRAGFYLLYTAGLDSDLHRYGIGDEHIASRLSWYRDRIERICSIDKRARVIVLGDHGMCDVSNQVDVVSMVNSSGLIVPDDFVPFYDSTMARFRVFNERARGSLEELLSNCRQGRIVRSEDLDRLGVAFEDGRYGDLIFLVQPGSIILPSFMGTSPVASMHGYHPDAECMYSVMFTNADVPWEECSICDVAAFLVPGFEAGGEGVRCGD